MRNDENSGLPRWKRVVDVTAILVALPLVVLLVIVIGIVIRVVSKVQFIQAGTGSATVAAGLCA